MKVYSLFVLLAALPIGPSLGLAQGLPPLWETPDWVDKDSLWTTRQDQLFILDGASAISLLLPHDDLEYDVPPAISLLSDDAFRKALFRDSRAADAKTVEAEIERKVTEYEKRFDELLRTLRNLENSKERIAEIDAFERETKALLGDLHRRLTPEQRERCERRFASAYFYKNGPVEFARRMGATEGELADVRSRLPEMRELLRTQLRELETKTLLEILGKLEGDGVEAMRKLVASTGPRRFGVIYPLHDELTTFDAPPIPMKKATSMSVKRNRMSAAGAPVLERKAPTDPFMDLIYLFSVQEISPQDREVGREFISMQFESLMPNADSEVGALKKKASELDRRIHVDKEADKVRLHAELEDVRSEIADLLNEEFDAAVRVLSDDGERAIEEGRLVLYMQRYGCASVLSSKYAQDRFGISIEAASWQKLDAAADELAASLRDRAVVVQQEAVKTLYRGTSLDKQFEEPWVRTADEDFPPVLEMLVVHSHPGGR